MKLRLSFILILLLFTVTSFSKCKAGVQLDAHWSGDVQQKLENERLGEALEKKGLDPNLDDHVKIQANAIKHY